jgi:energy-coupling factor transporter ATP-binding protein EcfA2
MTVASVEGLTVHGPDAEPLVVDVSLAVEDGEMVLLAGPSGSGKSIFGTALGGLLGDRPSLTVSGSIERNGEIGMLFQDPYTQLVREDVLADVAFGLENHGVDPATIHERIDSWADRLDATHLLDREVASLSRGETTLVALLGTLVLDPDLIVLDEPLAPLDAGHRRLVIDALDELREHASLLVAEHDVTDLLERADRVALLEDGRIQDRGRPREVVASLRAAGVRLPFATAVALERGVPTDRIPLTGG